MSEESKNATKDRQWSGLLPCRMVFRSKEGVELFMVPSKRSDPTCRSEERSFLLEGPTTLQAYSADGKILYVHQSNRGVVALDLEGRTSGGNNGDSDHGNDANGNDAKDHRQLFTLKDSGGVQMLSVSPLGTFLLTWERLSSSNSSGGGGGGGGGGAAAAAAAAPPSPNMKVWNAKTGAFLHGFVQKNLKRESWPYLQWTHDEAYAFLLVTNEVRVYERDSFAENRENGDIRFVDKLRISGITSLSVPRSTSATSASPASSTSPSSYLLTSFVPQNKDKPARASLHRYSRSPLSSSSSLALAAKAGASSSNHPALVSKSVFQAEEATVHWSPRGDSALMSLQTSVDASGASYYGSTTLYLLSETSKEPVAVPLPKESANGPVLDVSWMPNGTKPPSFAVISGRMPSTASLHHGVTAVPNCLLGSAHRNTLVWAPHGRFLCVAGFGNLAGGMTFWDRNKQKIIPQYDPVTNLPLVSEVVANCTVGYGWSPDSSLFGVSTTSPRMNVDNGVRLFRYNGQELVDNVPWDNKNYRPDRLLQASFVMPSSPSFVLNAYPDRPQSPAPRIVQGAEGVDDAAIAEAKRKAREASQQPQSASSQTRRYVPPSQRNRAGAAGATGGSSLAERMRREKEGSMTTSSASSSTTKLGGVSAAFSSGGSGRKLPVGMAPSNTGGGGGATKSKNALKKERQRLNKQKQQEEEERKRMEEEAAAEAAANDPEKRARKLKKLLKQIDDLKQRNAGTLNDDQQRKVDSEASVREELASLGVSG